MHSIYLSVIAGLIFKHGWITLNEGIQNPAGVSARRECQRYGQRKKSEKAILIKCRKVRQKRNFYVQAVTKYMSIPAVVCLQAI